MEKVAKNGAADTSVWFFLGNGREGGVQRRVLSAPARPWEAADGAGAFHPHRPQGAEPLTSVPTLGVVSLAHGLRFGL